MAREPSPKSGALPRGALRAIVLALLAEQPQHGYALCQALSSKTQGNFRLSEGSLYPLLHELELEGIVKAKESISETGRKRRVYHLTRTGRVQTEKWRKHWLATAEMLVELLSPDGAESV